MDKDKIIKDLKDKQTSLGIEFGSTRIKGVLIDSQTQVIAEGGYNWENQLVDGIWTYSLDEVWKGLQHTYLEIYENVKEKYNYKLTEIGAIGFSAMMHGYMAFDENDTLLVPFRTWRNAMTLEAERNLTKILNHNIPQRWSIAHLYQAVLNREEHVKDIKYFTTLAGYVHWKLTGEKVIGVGDASGMFPIDPKTKDYDEEMILLMNQELNEQDYDLDIKELLPKSLVSGMNAGFLSKEGAKLLDPTGNLKVGIPFVPPEGDAGTGMVATNSIAKNTGNISAGTSVFAMIVLDKKLSKVYPEIDIVTTPEGNSVAMVHVNNCTTEINAWINLFSDLLTRMNVKYDIEALYSTVFNAIEDVDENEDSILSYGYHSGENITKVYEGRPLLVRLPGTSLTLPNLISAQLKSAFATLNIGMQTLIEEGVRIDSVVGHGGIFKTEGVAQKVVAQALESPLTVMKTASEGGAWGMALLASYLNHANKMSLSEYLNHYAFKDMEKITYTPSKEEIEKYKAYVSQYEKGLEIERSAIENFKGDIQ